MEALANIAVGFSINFVANILILPAVLGVPVNLGELGFIGILYTVISLVRSYTLRRAFNGRSIWQAIKDRFGNPFADAIAEAREVEASIEDRVQQARERVEQLIGRP
jgi:hypothetical protein